MATPAFRDWLNEANATLEALRQGRLVAEGPDGDAFLDGYRVGLLQSAGTGDQVKADSQTGPWMLGYRIGLAGWVVRTPGPGFVERARDACRRK
jgi:hypothetical protein